MSHPASGGCLFGGRSFRAEPVESRTRNFLNLERVILFLPRGPRPLSSMKWPASVHALYRREGKNMSSIRTDLFLLVVLGLAFS